MVRAPRAVGRVDASRRIGIEQRLQEGVDLRDPSAPGDGHARPGGGDHLSSLHISEPTRQA
ncbi:hypothetical protein, partial [Clavibacter michiganensis]|uniref:hypothetical protein n=1 Tax=Clavibacter michiganensis TaxID=28447 RepID=UPI00292CCC91